MLRESLREDGHPVSCAMVSKALENEVGISLVYTPPLYRGRGYAKGWVAQVSQMLLDVGYNDHSIFKEIMF